MPHPLLRRADGSAPLALLALTSLTALACSPKPSPPQDPAPAALTHAQLDAVERSVLDGFSQLVHERADQDGSPFRLHASRVSAWAHEPEWASRALTALYRERDFKPRWVNPSAELWRPEGAALLALLMQAVEDHGLTPQDLGLPQVALRLSDARHPELPPLALDAQERQRLERWLGERPELLADLLGPGADPSALLEVDGPLPRHSALLEQGAERLALARQARLELDAALTMATLRLARVLRLDHDAWLRERAWPEDLRAPQDKPQDKPPSPALQAQRRERWALELMRALLDDALNPQARAQALAALEPPFAQYALLKNAHKTYAQIVASGGWSQVPASVIDLKPGSRHPDLPALKARLRRELLWPGQVQEPQADPQAEDHPEDQSDVFTPALREALLTYQHTHQLAAPGLVTQETWRSLNVPARRRLLELRHAMDQWRHSRIGPDEYYIHVNIPDFHAEIWDQGKLTWRQRVVTGSNARRKDPKTGRWELPHATAQFSDQLKFLVFNPYWNVPEAIIKEEIQPALAKDPEHLTKNHYEWVETSPGNRILRQTPGPHNALGLVKFLFPNEHNIYLHDTPLKRFFDEPVRAFSHGCVRVKDPMALAKLLLEREDRYSESRVKGWIEGGKEVWLTLKQPVPVHIEYIAARADEQGRAHFLFDAYRQNIEPLTSRDARETASVTAGQALAMVHALRPQPAEELAALNP